MVERLCAPAIQRFVARNWNWASSGCALIRSSVANIVPVSTPLRMVSLTAVIEPPRAVVLLVTSVLAGRPPAIGATTQIRVAAWRHARIASAGTTIVALRHETRFCTSPGGVGLAFAIDGEGPPLVKASNWMTHLDYERESPVWRHWVRELSRGRTLVRYDERGCGLSDRRFEGMPTLDTYVGDLAAVVDAAGLERFALLALSGGGPTAIEYAARNPQRVSHLVLYGTWARGRDLRGAPE